MTTQYAHNVLKYAITDLRCVLAKLSKYGLNKMDNILHKKLWSAFSWAKIIVFY